MALPEPGTSQLISLSQEMFPPNAPVLWETKHVLEQRDMHHRYGTYLRPYFIIWCFIHGKATSDITEENCRLFFEWLDGGSGKDFDLLITCVNYLDNGNNDAANSSFRCNHEKFKDQLNKLENNDSINQAETFIDVLRYANVISKHVVSRDVLEQSRVHYFSEEERCKWLVHIEKDTQRLAWVDCAEKCSSYVDTGNEERHMFVIDRCLNLFIHKKVKGKFHHSSLVDGGKVRAAGLIQVRDGTITQVAPNSGHYRNSLDDVLRALFDLFGPVVLPMSSLFIE